MMSAEEMMDVVNTVCNKICENISTEDLIKLIDLYVTYCRYDDITKSEIDSIYEEIVDMLDSEDIKVFL